MAALPTLLRRLPRLDWASLMRGVQGAFTRNFGFKALAVLVAVGLWAWGQGEQVVEQRARVQLEWTLPENLALVGDVPDSISLTASGSQVFVRNLRDAHLRIRVDLSDAGKGAQVVEFEERRIENLPQNLHVVGISPTRIEFELDEKVNKRVKLTPVTQGEPAEGYRLLDVSVEPTTVEVLGAASTLVGMDEVPTSVVNVAGLQASARREVLLGRIPGGVTRVDDVPIVVNVEVESLSRTQAFDGVPVVIRSHGWATTIETVAVAVSGPVADVSSLKVGDLTVVVTVGPDVAPGPVDATQNGSPVGFQVVMPYADRLTATKVAPSRIPLIPVE
ncbi:MAG: CdaR family protein [Pseudomonadota bacterium]